MRLTGRRVAVLAFIIPTLLVTTMVTPATAHTVPAWYGNNKAWVSPDHRYLRVDDNACYPSASRDYRAYAEGYDYRAGVSTLKVVWAQSGCLGNYWETPGTYFYLFRVCVEQTGCGPWRQG